MLKKFNDESYFEGRFCHQKTVVTKWCSTGSPLSHWLSWRRKGKMSDLRFRLSSSSSTAPIVNPPTLNFMLVKVSETQMGTSTFRASVNEGCHRQASNIPEKGECWGCVYRQTLRASVRCYGGRLVQRLCCTHRKESLKMTQGARILSRPKEGSDDLSSQQQTRHLHCSMKV